jgi:hypothetical protein
MTQMMIQLGTESHHEEKRSGKKLKRRDFRKKEETVPLSINPYKMEMILGGGE